MTDAYSRLVVPYASQCNFFFRRFHNNHYYYSVMVVQFSVIFAEQTAKRVRPTNLCCSFTSALHNHILCNVVVSLLHSLCLSHLQFKCVFSLWFIDASMIYLSSQIFFIASHAATIDHLYANRLGMHFSECKMRLVFLHSCGANNTPYQLYGNAIIEVH